MAVSVSRRKPRLTKRVDHTEPGFLAKLVFRAPIFLLLFIFVFLWSSSTTVISGNVVHVCISSRKLTLYCLSAGTQPNFEIPIPIAHNTSVDSVDNPNVKEKSGDISVISGISKARIGIHKDLSSVDHPTNSGIANDHYGEDGDFVDHPNVKEKGRDISVNSGISKARIGIHKDLASVDLPNPSSGTENDEDGDLGYHPDINSAIAKLEDEDIQDQRSSNPGIAKTREEELAYAKKLVEEQMELHRSFDVVSNPGTCDGRGIYVYELPPKFNKDLMAQCGEMTPWVDFCKYFRNNALGEPIPALGKGWYQTHQYSLEPIFHSRILKHRCRVHNQDEAKLFYVPYYGGLDILRWHFKNVSKDVKDSLGNELVKWLKPKKAWTRSGGKDHVFVLGKISWDFRRRDESNWGTRFLSHDQMQNPIKLLIERQPWHVNDIGIPHPTHFHPSSDSDIVSWQTKIISSSRKSLVSFAGAPRPGAPQSIRSILIKQCTSFDVSNCKFLNCAGGGCDKPETVINLFTESEFCLQPPGDSPTRKSVFDSLVSGCIPVIFDPFTAYYQYPWHLPADHGKYSMFIDQEEVREMKVNVVETLLRIPKSVRDDMRRYIVYELLPGLVYGDPNSELDTFQDAFTLTMNHLIERVSRLGSSDQQ